MLASWRGDTPWAGVRDQPGSCSMATKWHQRPHGAAWVSSGAPDREAASEVVATRRSRFTFCEHLLSCRRAPAAVFFTSSLRAMRAGSGPGQLWRQLPQRPSFRYRWVDMVRL